MKGNPVGVERRLHSRYKVKDGAYAALSPDSSIMGQVINISKGGLSFRYIVHADQFQESSTTHVFVGDSGLYLEKMPFEVVADNYVDTTSSINSIVMRQRRVRFLSLTSNQLAQLEYFLLNRTQGIDDTDKL